jgi:high-affinity iron transporter
MQRKIVFQSSTPSFSPRFHVKKKFSCLLTFIILGLAVSLPAFAQTASETLENKIKKIVMMMNIVAKEYKEGILNGEVINPGEYEESQIFLEQAHERFRKLPAPSTDTKDGAVIAARFAGLTGDVKAKVDPPKVREQVSTINSTLLDLYGIKISLTPVTPISLANGKKIYEANCAICHGLTGKANGPIAHQFNPPPAVLADPTKTGDKQTVAYDNFQVINVGIAGTGMVGWADLLTEPEIWDVTYYIRTFSNTNVKLPLIEAGLTASPNQSSGEHKAEEMLNDIRAQLDRSLTAFKDNHADEAAEIAFDAYLTYEKIESGLINKNKDLGLRLESMFSRYRAEIKRGAALDLVSKIHAGMIADLNRAEEILKEKIGFAGLFLQSLSIIVREGFEAILIVAALIAFLRKSRNQDKLKSIYYGVTAGIAGSFLTAYLLHEVFKVSMASQEILEGWIMLIAVLVLFWVSYWLVSKIEAQKWQDYITRKMKTAVTTGSTLALGAVAFFSVYREGFETVLFYKALYLYAEGASGGILPGFLAGCLILAAVYYLINQVGIRIPIKWFFAFTSVFLYFMAFTFMGKGLHELQMGEQLSMTPAEFLPTVSWMGIYPTWETFIGQGILLLAYVGALIYTFGIQPEVEQQHLKEETSQLQVNITAVHDLVEHISHHAKRCEIFLKDTRDQDLKELSEHLKEIDEKVHELFAHVEHVENDLLDEFEKLGRAGFTPSQKKALS